MFSCGESPEANRPTSLPVRVLRIWTTLPVEAETARRVPSGEIAMWSLVILLITGTFLTLWFVPSMGHVVYDGSYVPLKGVGMSEAYASTLHISFEVKGGLLMRQLHHWSALFFIVGIALHAAWEVWEAAGEERLLAKELERP